MSSIKITEEWQKLETLIPSFDADKTYQLQNISGSIVYFKNSSSYTDDNRFMLKDGQIAMFKKSDSFDVYVSSQFTSELACQVMEE